jgi:3-hydroxyacyl-CoA dehydrogenase
VLASNTSGIQIMKIAAAIKNPSRVLGLHFFNLPRMVEAGRLGKKSGKASIPTRDLLATYQGPTSASRDVAFGHPRPNWIA